eukprot:TRINITY_DN9552_c0_g2_i6.p1 TRINITY_DN9552_c0_g2~~TRINITY_DN9552_c0_g2_i6.p1  ORF type:complete len:313 (-),score=24.96 TRINITY_DN9552_c0_g2_i6:122-1060(-)
MTKTLLKSNFIILYLLLTMGISVNLDHNLLVLNQEMKQEIEVTESLASNTSDLCNTTLLTEENNTLPSNVSAFGNQTTLHATQELNASTSHEDNSTKDTIGLQTQPSFGDNSNNDLWQNFSGLIRRVSSGSFNCSNVGRLIADVDISLKQLDKTLDDLSYEDLFEALLFCRKVIKKINKLATRTEVHRHRSLINELERYLDKISANGQSKFYVNEDELKRNPSFYKKYRNVNSKLHEIFLLLGDKETSDEDRTSRILSKSHRLHAFVVKFMRDLKKTLRQFSKSHMILHLKRHHLSNYRDSFCKNITNVRIK